MIQATEIVGGVWVFNDTSEGRNWGVVMAGEQALVVGPGSAPTNLDATEQFVNEAGGKVGAVVSLSSHEQAPGPDYWPGAQRVNPVSIKRRTALPAEGWAALPLAAGRAGRLGVYGLSARALFCGDVLPESGMPSLAGGAQSYLDSLSTIENLDVKLVVPQRGAPAVGKREIRGRIENDRSYVYSLLRHVSASIVSGVSLERALNVASQAYEDYPYLQEHLSNIEHVWDETREA